MLSSRQDQVLLKQVIPAGTKKGVLCYKERSLAPSLGGCTMEKQMEMDRHCLVTESNTSIAQC